MGHITIRRELSHELRSIRIVIYRTINECTMTFPLPFIKCPRRCTTIGKLRLNWGYLISLLFAALSAVISERCQNLQDLNVAGSCHSTRFCSLATDTVIRHGAGFPGKKKYGCKPLELGQGYTVDWKTIRICLSKSKIVDDSLPKSIERGKVLERDHHSFAPHWCVLLVQTREQITKIMDCLHPPGIEEPATWNSNGSGDALPGRACGKCNKK